MMKRILILIAISLFLCSTASAFQGGGGESTKKKENPKKTSGTKTANTTPPRPPAPPAREEEARSPIPLPSPFTPVVDYSNVIDADTRRKLESIYRNLKQQANIEFLVVTVDTTGEQDIFDYSLAIYRSWSNGYKTKDSFLLLLAIKDRKYQTLVGSYLQGDLNDGLLGEIQRKYLVPEAKKGNYSQGIYNTVHVYVATLAQKRGFTIEGIDVVAAPNPPPTNSANSQPVSSGWTFQTLDIPVEGLRVYLYPGWKDDPLGGAITIETPGGATLHDEPGEVNHFGFQPEGGLYLSHGSSRIQATGADLQPLVAAYVPI